MEYWARLGTALDAAGISTASAMELLGNGAPANAFVAAALGRGHADDLGMPLLKERQRKDAEEVSAGLRSARSLWVVQEGDLEGYSFTASETEATRHCIRHDSGDIADPGRSKPAVTKLSPSIHHLAPAIHPTP